MENVRLFCLIMTSQTSTLPCLLALAFTTKTTETVSKFSSLVGIRAQFDTKNAAGWGTAGESSREPTLHLERMTEIDDWERNYASPLPPPCVVALSPGVSSCGPHAESRWREELSPLSNQTKCLSELTGCDVSIFTAWGGGKIPTPL